MKTSGSLLLVVGAVWALIAFNSDTTVYVDGPFSKKVQNVGLMDERRNHLLMASLLVVVGVILFSFGNTHRTKSATAATSPALVSDSEDYKNSRYNGLRNITSGKYQLFLTKKYAIEKNTTLEKYVVEDNLFQTLEEALAFCDDKEGQTERERQKKAYRIEDVRQNSNAELAGIQVGDILVAYNRRAIASSTLSDCLSI